MEKKLNLSKILWLFAIVFSLGFFVACGEDDDNSDDSTGTNTATSVTNTVNNGTWKITLFNDSGDDETNHFTGYNFTFGANNVLTATNGSNTYNGTWSVADSNSNDDSISDLHFYIAFTAPDNFTDLTEDWNIIEKSSTVIKLKHVSGGNGGTDYLTFTKN